MGKYGGGQVKNLDTFLAEWLSKFVWTIGHEQAEIMVDKLIFYTLL